jgi:hypothetical protein
LWGFVAAFGASYAGKQLMVLKGIGQAEGFFFIDRINEVREANNNQPLMGLLILSALFFMLSGPAVADFDLPEFELPDLALTIEMATEASEAMEEALAEEELLPHVYVLEGKSNFETLWGELAAKFGSENATRIINLNGIGASDHKRGLEVIIPEDLELPED